MSFFARLVAFTVALFYLVVWVTELLDEVRSKLTNATPMKAAPLRQIITVLRGAA
ncbi:MAG: hypothetical protein WAL67_06170 [Candidatus Cybelea sp.]